MCVCLYTDLINPPLLLSESGRGVQMHNTQSAICRVSALEGVWAHASGVRNAMCANGRRDLGRGFWVLTASRRDGGVGDCRKMRRMAVKARPADSSGVSVQILLHTINRTSHHIIRSARVVSRVNRTWLLLAGGLDDNDEDGGKGI
jgi:hypothetical protein